MHLMKTMVVTGLFLLAAVRVSAYSIGWSRVAGGGSSGGLTTDGMYSVAGTAGQHDAAVERSGGAYIHAGGFWVGIGLGNSQPVVHPDTVARLNTSVVAKIPVAVLLANDTDANGDPLSLVTVGDATPAGATVSVVGPWVVYTAPSGSAGDGSFVYYVSDGQGGAAVGGNVEVLEVPPPDPDGNPNAVAVTVEGGNVRVTFIGIPGDIYRVQYTTDTAGPYTWQEFSPQAVYQASSGTSAGVFRHLDVQPAEPFRLYRAILEP